MASIIITGASAGLGRCLARAAAKEFPEIDEYWLIARREDKLKEAAAELSGKKIVILPLDLCDTASFDVLEAELKARGTDVKMLVNNCGCGYLNNVGDGALEDQTRMIDLNVRALTAVTHIVLAHMSSGAKIINISSIASFCPNPRMTVYSSTKAYVTAFTKGISCELRPKGITATAVCPGPMDTEFIYLGGIKGKSKMFDTLPYCDPERVALGAIRAAKKGRVMYTPKMFYKFYRFLAKILPTKLVMKLAKT